MPTQSVGKLESAWFASPIVDFPEYFKKLPFRQVSVNIALIVRFYGNGNAALPGVTSETSDVVNWLRDPDSEPEWSTKLAQNVLFHGGNFRLNANSTDSSNFVSLSNEQLFFHLREKARAITDVAERNEIVTRLDKLQKAQDSGGFLQRVSLLNLLL